MLSGMAAHTIPASGGNKECHEECHSGGVRLCGYVSLTAPVPLRDAQLRTNGESKEARVTATISISRMLLLYLTVRLK